MDAITQGWRVGWLWLLLSFMHSAHAMNVGVFSPQLIPAVAQLARALEGHDGRSVVVVDSLEAVMNTEVDWWILAGPEAHTQAATVRLMQPSVAVFVSREQSQPHLAVLRSAIYVEPPLVRQLALARLLLGEQRPLGILTSDQASWSSSLAHVGLARTTPYFVDQYDSLNHALTQLLRTNAAVVGDYDLALFSAENIKTILITAYRHNKPLIGPSSAYLRAGSLASTYSDVDDVAQQLLQMMTHFQQHDVLLTADYNPYFKVRFNEQVARSLNIPLPDPEEARRALRQKELHP